MWLFMRYHMDAIRGWDKIVDIKAVSFDVDKFLEVEKRLGEVLPKVLAA